MSERRASLGTASPGRGGDFVPEDIPVRPAATVLILDERPDLHVLMLKRNARSIFVGDMWVFPGGAVDPEDGHADLAALVEGRTDSAASAELGLDSGGLAYWIAALRETFEEAGVILTSTASPPPQLDDPGVAARFEDHRTALNAGTAAFTDIAAAEGLRLDAHDVHYVGRWVTPLGSPRRYDTRFFVTSMPTGQVALHDNDEAVHHEWVRPADALARNETDDMVMLTPTLAMLGRLAGFADTATALAAASKATRGDDEHVRIRYDVESHHRIAFPDEPDYADADPEVEFGVMRWPRA